MKVSSMYRHHVRGFLSQSLKIFSSKSLIYIIAYDGAILVPVAVPLNCLWKEVLCSNILFFKMHSANSIRESVETVLSSLHLMLFALLPTHSHEGY